jgi:GAF domain-containing protein
VHVTSRQVTEILAAVATASRNGTGLTDGLLRACAAALPVTGAGLALTTDTGPAGPVAATDRAALHLEELQFLLGEGPSIDASRTGRPVLEPDLARTAPRLWPAFAEGAAEAGVRAVFAFPLRVGGIRLGVLELHRDAPGVLSPRELADALAFTDAATALLLHLQSVGTVGQLPLDVASAIDHRAEVHQASGVVSVQAGVSLAVALVMLRARAYADQRPVGAVARDVLRGRLHLGPDDG